jgi:hypothetical protein
MVKSNTLTITVTAAPAVEVVEHTISLDKTTINVGEEVTLTGYVKFSAPAPSGSVLDVYYYYSYYVGGERYGGEGGHRWEDIAGKTSLSYTFKFSVLDPGVYDVNAFARLYMVGGAVAEKWSNTLKLTVKAVVDVSSNTISVDKSTITARQSVVVSGRVTFTAPLPSDSTLNIELRENDLPVQSYSVRVRAGSTSADYSFERPFYYPGTYTLYTYAGIAKYVRSNAVTVTVLPIDYDVASNTISIDKTTIPVEEGLNVKGSVTFKKPLPVDDRLTVYLSIEGAGIVSSWVQYIDVKAGTSSLSYEFRIPYEQIWYLKGVKAKIYGKAGIIDFVQSNVIEVTFV